MRSTKSLVLAVSITVVIFGGWMISVADRAVRSEHAAKSEAWRLKGELQTLQTVSDTWKAKFEEASQIKCPEPPKPEPKNKARRSKTPAFGRDAQLVAK